MMSPTGAVRTAVTPAVGVSPMTMMARNPPTRSPAKRVVKKAVKRVVKEPVKKAVKRVVKKPIKKAAPAKRNPFSSGGGVSAARGGSGKSEIGKLATNTISAVKGYGGGNGEVLFNPTTAAAIVAWLLILARFVLFYGAFGGE
jgi:hypothetical protein